MVTLSMGDISDPGTMLVTEDVVAFYLGGRTPHVWTPVQVHMQTARWRHPIWVYGNRPGSDGGRLDGLDVVAALKALGAPKGIAVSFDMETAVDGGYLEAADAELKAAGFFASEYGSRDFIAANPVLSGGRWTAEWTGIPHYTGLPGEWACQWQRAGATGDDHPWDVSVVNEVSQLWDTRAPVTLSAVLVQLPTGSTRVVHSSNNGVTWE